VGEGRERRVVRCECRQRVRADRLLQAARIPRRYQHCELAEFDTAYPGAHPSLAQAKLFAARFVANYPVEDKGLLLVGSVGVGKTHLAVGIIKELILTKGVQCLFYDYRELLKEIRNSYNPSVAATEMDVLRPALNAPVLVLDELGAERPTDWVWDTVSHILNTRYNEKRTTIITTNFVDAPPAGEEPVDNFSRARRAAREETLGDRITERMRSRLHEMCRKVEMDGKDFRLKIRCATCND
jgi:DNA replication protein DnaC